MLIIACQLFPAAPEIKTRLGKVAAAIADLETFGYSARA